MSHFANKIEYVTKYSMISLFFILALSTQAMAEEEKKFNFGFDRLESIIYKNSVNWNINYANPIKAPNLQAKTPKQDTPAVNAIKRFAALSASLLVEFTSDDSFNEIEVN